MDSGSDIELRHYVFFVDAPELGASFDRIQERSIPFWADPLHQSEKDVNANDGGRGVYFDDPRGHDLEIIAKPCGSGS